MHANFTHLGLSLIVEAKTLKKQILKDCRNHLMQCEFCKPYNLANWLFQIARLANWVFSHEEFPRDFSSLCISILEHTP